MIGRPSEAHGLGLQFRLKLPQFFFSNLSQVWVQVWVKFIPGLGYRIHAWVRSGGAEPIDAIDANEAPAAAALPQTGIDIEAGERKK